jgi:hypothetical protein
MQQSCYFLWVFISALSIEDDDIGGGVKHSKRRHEVLTWRGGDSERWGKRGWGNNGVVARAREDGDEGAKIGGWDDDGMGWTREDGCM